MNKLILTICLLIAGSSTTAIAQQKGFKASLFEGTIVAGYADKGAYINCTGPAVKYTRAKTAFLLGLLPSLKIKEDKVEEGLPSNSLITPTLGFGLTATIGHLALQVPAYYNAKTATADGQWKLGFGVGYKF